MQQGGGADTWRRIARATEARQEKFVHIPKPLSLGKRLLLHFGMDLVAKRQTHRPGQSKSSAGVSTNKQGGANIMSNQTLLVNTLSQD